MSKRIRVDVKNFNKHTPEGMELLEKSISEVGAIESVTVDAEGEIITGNARKETFDKLGYKPKFIELKENEYPVIQTDLSGEKRVKAAIYANTVAQKNINLDLDLIQEVAIEEYELEFEGLGVDLEEVHLEVQEDDFNETPPENPITELGDLYEIGEHRLLCGDSTDGSVYDNLFKDEMCDLWLTDPPYNVDYEGKTKDKLKIQGDKMHDADFRQFLSIAFIEAANKMKSGAAFYIFHADTEGFNFRGGVMDAGLALRQCLVWVKNGMVFGRQDYHWMHEPILYGWKDGAAHRWFADRSQTTVLEFKKPLRNAEHPTIKPIELLSYLINNSSKKGDVVFDNFLGSGSTMVSSHQLGRKCYGLELDPKYCDVIVKRMITHDPKLTIKRNGVNETEMWLNKINSNG